MIDPDVRPAVSGDVDALTALEFEARAALVDARGGARWLEEHPALGGGWLGAVVDRHVFVAVLDASVVVGYLVLDLVGDIATVDQVFVTPEARDLGFGDALLGAASDRGRQLAARLIEGQALPGDRDTKNLYERAKITARLITVSRSL